MVTSPQLLSSSHDVCAPLLPALTSVCSKPIIELGRLVLTRSICNGCLKKVKCALDKVQSPALVWLCGLSDLGTACLCIVSPCMEAAQHTPVEIFMDSMNGVHNY